MRKEKFFSYISETIRYRKFILDRDNFWTCRCANSWCDLDLTFDLAMMTITFKILSQLYPRKRNVQEFDI